MRLWQTGAIGPHNIDKIEDNPKNGFKTYEKGRTALIAMFKKPDSEVRQDNFSTFAVMELFWED